MLRPYAKETKGGREEQLIGPSISLKIKKPRLWKSCYGVKWEAVREESLVLAIDTAAVWSTAASISETITVFTTASSLSTIAHTSFLSLTSSITQGGFATILASLAIAMISANFASFEASAIIFLAACSRAVA